MGQQMYSPRASGNLWWDPQTEPSRVSYQVVTSVGNIEQWNPIRGVDNYLLGEGVHISWDKQGQMREYVPPTPSKYEVCAINIFDD